MGWSEGESSLGGDGARLAGAPLVGSLGETWGHFFSGTEGNGVPYLKWQPEQVRAMEGGCEGGGTGRTVSRVRSWEKRLRMEAGRLLRRLPQQWEVL